MTSPRDGFFTLADHLRGCLQGNESFAVTYAGECSDFVRLNRNQVRQAGSIQQQFLTVDLIDGRRHAIGQLTVSGDFSGDAESLRVLLLELRTQCQELADDPYLLVCTNAQGTVHEAADELPESMQALDQLRACAHGLDLVGLWASGVIHAGFASSYGQRSWHATHSFSLDWSCYGRAGRAVSCRYAGSRWDVEELRHKMELARQQLAALDGTARTVLPGKYRAYIAPDAVNDLLGMLGWGGFSCKAQRTRTSPLLRLASGEASFHPSVHLVEDREKGLSPGFTSEGFAKSPRVTLIDAGRPAEVLISPRSAQEFGLQPNSDGESPECLSMAAGTLERDAILAQLDTGLWIGNVWYCNYSDRNSCRITGMTRFACFWVEKGTIVAPLPVMRFDDSLYQLLGDRLIGITRQREQQLANSTYGGRAFGGTLLPGILVDALTLTL
jgi:predicted Zn-dependent protease